MTNKNSESKFERLILGIPYNEGSRLKHLQDKSINKGLKGDEVFEFIHLDRKELVDKIEILKKEVEICSREFGMHNMDTSIKRIIGTLSKV